MNRRGLGVQILRPYLHGVLLAIHSDHAALRFLMEIDEPSGRLMRWSLRIGDFEFRIEYKKGIIKTQADALPRLPILGSTVIPIKEEIPCIIVFESDNEGNPEPIEFSTLPELENFVAEPYTLATDQIIVTPDQPSNSTSSGGPVMVTITEPEIKLAKRDDQFCSDICHRLGRCKNFRS